jgi:hypothetical protein
VTAFAIALFIVWCVIQWHIGQIENPPPRGTHLFIVAYDYPSASDWCWQQSLNPRDPCIHILTKPHHAQGFTVHPNDRIIDLHGPQTVLDLLESQRVTRTRSDA